MKHDPDRGDAGYDDVIDAIEAGEGYYLACSEGHGSMPPRVACPQCGDTDLTAEPLPDRGEILTYTRTEVSTPDFTDDSPYVVAVVDMGPVRLTGQLQNVDPESIPIGATVTPVVKTRKTTDDPLLAFELVPGSK